MEDIRKYVRYCPLIKGDCLGADCSMAMTENQSGNVFCSFNVKANELAKMRIDTYIISERLKDQNMRLDRQNVLLQLIADFIAR